MKALNKTSNFIEKLPRWAGFAAIIITIVFAAAHETQSLGVVLPQMLVNLGLLTAAEMPTLLVWIVGPLGSWLTFEIVLMFFLSIIRPTAPMLDRKIAAHYARLVFAAANILLGIVGLFYFYFPLILVMGQKVIEFIITSAFCLLYYFLISRRFVPNFLWGRLLMQMGTIYLIYNGAMIMFEIMGAAA